MENYLNQLHAFYLLIDISVTCFAFLKLHSFAYIGSSSRLIVVFLDISPPSHKTTVRLSSVVKIKGNNTTMEKYSGTQS